MEGEVISPESPEALYRANRANSGPQGEESAPSSIKFLHGDATALPFEDGSFRIVCLITSLEFISGPDRALAEAFRVAEDFVLIGFLNKYSLWALMKRLKGIMTETVYRKARFFSLGELKKLAWRVSMFPSAAFSARNVKARWGWTLHFPTPAWEPLLKFLDKLEGRVGHRLPGGAFGAFWIKK